MNIPFLAKFLSRVDQARGIDQIRERARNFLGCGDVAKRMLGGLALVGIDCRLAAVFTSEEYNFKTDGHNVIEIKMGSDWVLYDAFLGVIIIRNNEPLNLLQACKAISDNDYQINPIGTLQLPSEIFGMDINKWIKRVYQIPLIYKDGIFYTYDFATVDRNKENQYSFLPYSTWLKLFYNEEEKLKAKEKT